MEERRSPLMFRVMRLGAQASIRRPPLSVISSSVGTDIGSGTSWEGEGVAGGVGMVSTLPTSFGTVYVGEQLRACVNLYNRSDVDVHVVRLKIDFQLPDKTLVSLFDGSGADHSTLSSGNWNENVVAVKIVQLGQHSIVCSALCTERSGGEPRSVKQTFRFHVVAPLKVAVGVIPLRHSDFFDDSTFLVDFRLTNLIPMPIRIHSAELSPAKGCTVSDLNRGEAQAAGDSEDDPLEYTDASTSSGDVVSFVYLVHRSEDSAPPRKDNKFAIGTLSISWHGAGGESGRIDDILAEAEAPKPPAEVEVTVAAVPWRIESQRPFTARCRVRNNSDYAIRLYLQVRRDMVGEIVPAGCSGQSLGEVPGKSSQDVLLSLVALSPGKHRIHGVRVLDIDSRHAYAAEAAEIVAV